MASCSHREILISLFETGEPICLPRADRAWNNLNFRVELTEELRNAITLAQSASIDLTAILSDIPEGLTESGTSRRIHNTVLQVNRIRTAMIKAHKSLSEFIDREIASQNPERNAASR